MTEIIKPEDHESSPENTARPDLVQAGVSEARNNMAAMQIALGDLLRFAEAGAPEGYVPIEQLKTFLDGNRLPFPMTVKQARTFGRMLQAAIEGRISPYRYDLNEYANLLELSAPLVRADLKHPHGKQALLVTPAELAPKKLRYVAYVDGAGVIQVIALRDIDPRGKSNDEADFALLLPDQVGEAVVVTDPVEAARKASLMERIRLLQDEELPLTAADLREFYGDNTVCFTRADLVLGGAHHLEFHVIEFDADVCMAFDDIKPGQTLPLKADDID
jgi:hypothetical protein